MQINELIQHLIFQKTKQGLGKVFWSWQVNLEKKFGLKSTFKRQ